MIKIKYINECRVKHLYAATSFYLTSDRILSRVQKRTKPSVIRCALDELVQLHLESEVFGDKIPFSKSLHDQSHNWSIEIEKLTFYLVPHICKCPK